jgi:hypothetical protein
MEGSESGDARYVVLALAIVWAGSYLLMEAFSGRWVPADPCSVCSLELLVWLSLIPMLMLTVAFVGLRLHRRQVSLGDAVPVCLVVAALVVGALIPAKPAMIFRLHREEFLELAEWVVDECDDSWQDVSRSPANLFDYTSVDCPASGPVVIYFTTVDDFRWQLVFISTDRPEDAWTCGPIGYVEAELEPQWYLCSRDID